MTHNTLFSYDFGPGHVSLGSVDGQMFQLNVAFGPLSGGKVLFNAQQMANLRDALIRALPIESTAPDPEEVSTALELLGYLNQVASGDADWATLHGVKLSRIVNSDGETAAEQQLRQTKQLLKESSQRYADLAATYVTAPLLEAPGQVELGEISLDPTDFDYRTKALELALAGNIEASAEDLVNRAAVLEGFLRNGKQDENAAEASA